MWGTGNMHEQEPRQAVCSYNLCFIHLLCHVVLQDYLVMPNASHRIHLAIGLKIGIHGRDILN